MSAVSIGELHRMDSQKQNVIELIITLFSASDVTIIGYTKDVALLLNKSFRDFLPEEKGKEFLSHLKKELNAVNFKNSRQWIDDDMKICACAKSLSKLDVVLTTDRNTFKPFADKMELPCVTVYPESFPKDIFGSIEGLD